MKMKCKGFGQRHTHPPFLAIYIIWRLKKKPEYGYSLAKHIQTFTMGYKKASTVYLILNKLEKNGLVKSKIHMKNSRSRKVYYTTKKGWQIFEDIKSKSLGKELKEFMKELIS